MKKRVLSILLAASMAASMLVSASASEAPDSELPDVELWLTNADGFLPVEKDGTLYNFYKEKLGVGIYSPYVEWNGGQTYTEQLSLRIASGDAPDVFLLYNGIENQLITDGALLDLTDYLEEYCPNLWEAVPESIWEIIKANDPTGEGRIWYAPALNDYTRHGALIRKDWLDALGLEVPTTKEELVEVLRAFKDGDPNGNGIADEIPTGGRAEARWMDYLFGMYGVAMFEGFPEWDLYDGELTYSAVTDNMKAALEFVSELYKEGLIDIESLLNDKATWDGKINSGVVGIYYHIPWYSYYYMTSIEAATGIQAEYVTLPVIKAEGYDGFVTVKNFASPGLAISATEDEDMIKASLKVLDASYDQSIAEEMRYGAEGMHFEYDENGDKVMLPTDPSIQEQPLILPYERIESDKSVTAQLEMVRTDDISWAVDLAEQNVIDNEANGKVIAGDGMPASVYDEYEDIQNRTLYVEYASKIISGEWPIDKFDEFVEKWYATGGTEVTEAAREWYANKTAE